jgi:putative membrane protein
MEREARMKFVSKNDEMRISAAIEANERKTSGEIVAIIAAESSSYSYVPYLFAALAALLVPLPLIFLTWWPIQWIYLIQLFVFGAGVTLLWSRPIRLALVPADVKRERAHRRAVEQFLVQNLHTTTGRTGVLIFVSVAERYAEILADHGIHAKVPQGTWDSLVAQLTSEIGADRVGDAFVHTIETIGDLLARHFPPGSQDPNELPNHLIVLDEAT